jgi:proteasome lid subunit RPN8/RPN11
VNWTPWLRAQLIARALAEAPREACGLVTQGKGGKIALWAAENVSEDPEHSFLIAPPTQFELLRESAKREEELVAIYHSHPNQGAAPSATDRELARLWPGLIWLIVGLNGAIESGDAEPDFFVGVLYRP